MKECKQVKLNVSIPPCWDALWWCGLAFAARTTAVRTPPRRTLSGSPGSGAGLWQNGIVLPPRRGKPGMGLA